MPSSTWHEILFMNAVDRTQQQALRATASAQSHLEARVGELERDNERLEAALVRSCTIVNVLGRVLVDTGVIDGALIRAELEAALAPPAPPPREQASTSPYRDARPAQPAPALVACAGCRATVPAASTQITENGALCEPCFTRIELERLARIESEG
jgi:hypothetical protein